MTYARAQRDRVRHPEAELIRDYGSHPLAFLGLAPENEHFLVSCLPAPFAPLARKQQAGCPDKVAGGTGLVSYRLTGNVAVVLGDPVCAPEACEQVMRSFLNFCALRDWPVAFYQASPEHLATYRALKLRAFKMGEEAILRPQSFTLRGSALANVRTSCRRAEREGITIQWYDGVPPAAVMQQLEHVSNAWLEHKVGERASERGFSTGRMNELINTAERAEMVADISTPSNSSMRAIPRFVTAVATTNAGTACAFVTFTPIYGCLTSEGTAMEGEGWGWALDMMRRVPGAPPGVMELLLVRAIERFRAQGAQVISLGLVAWADTQREMTSGQRQLASLVTDRLLGGQRTLFSFKQKFHPCWESRYLVVNTTLALPKIALAVLRVRNYSGGAWTRLIN